MSADAGVIKTYADKLKNESVLKEDLSELKSKQQIEKDTELINQGKYKIYWYFWSVL